MKKVLIGILSISAFAFATAPNLGADPTENTNVFQTGQFGKIDIKATLTSNVPLVKYVVYASNDNGTTKEDKLALSDFIISQEEAKVGFVNENPKVYVKRVNGTSTDVLDLALEENVKIKLVSDPSYNSETFTNWYGMGETLEILPTMLLTQSALQKVIDYARNPYETLAVNGVIQNPDGTTIYAQPKSIHIIQTEKGIIETKSEIRTILTDKKVTAYALNYQSAFNGGISLSGVKFIIQVN